MNVLSSMRRMDAPPALEVVTDWVWWNAGMWSEALATTEYPTVPEGCSHVSLRTGRVTMDVGWGRNEWGAWEPTLDALPEEYFLGIFHQAPPKWRTFSVGPASRLGDAGQPWPLQLTARDGPSLEGHSSTYDSAAKLAEALQPFADAAGITLRIDEQSQELHLTRTYLDYEA